MPARQQALHYARLNANAPMLRPLIILGLALILVGATWPWLSRLGLGRLPGDILIERGQSRLYIPITSSLVVSLVLTALAWWWRR